MQNLIQMGFSNEKLNMDALVKAKGNMEMAVDIVIKMMSNPELNQQPARKTQTAQTRITEIPSEMQEKLAGAGFTDTALIQQAWVRSGENFLMTVQMLQDYDKGRQRQQEALYQAQAASQQQQYQQSQYAQMRQQQLQLAQQQQLQAQQIYGFEAPPQPNQTYGGNEFDVFSQPSVPQLQYQTFGNSQTFAVDPMRNATQFPHRFNPFDRLAQDQAVKTQQSPNPFFQAQQSGSRPQIASEFQQPQQNNNSQFIVQQSVMPTDPFAGFVNSNHQQQNLLSASNAFATPSLFASQPQQNAPQNQFGQNFSQQTAAHQNVFTVTKQSDPFEQQQALPNQFFDMQREPAVQARSVSAATQQPVMQPVMSAQQAASNRFQQPQMSTNFDQQFPMQPQQTVNTTQQQFQIQSQTQPNKTDSDVKRSILSMYRAPKPQEEQSSHFGMISQQQLPQQQQYPQMSQQGFQGYQMQQLQQNQFDQTNVQSITNAAT